MRLADVVATAVADQRAPAAALALLYAARIDDASHLPVALDKALRTVRGACLAADNPLPALDALDKISAALSAVTVTSDLGPKLLAALDALLLTPKARAAASKAIGAAAPASPLQQLKARHDDRHLRPVG